MSTRVLATVAVLLGLLASVGFPAASRAADSLAPPGSPRTWLPNEAWVLDHWLPYDEGRLFSALHTDRDAVRKYFEGAKAQRVPTLADFATKRGLNPRKLARSLVDAWHPHVSAARRRLLLDRALRSLTQGHLMQHMMFHPLHDRALNRASVQIFGVQIGQLNQALRAGMSRAQVGAQHGRSAQKLTALATAVLRRTQDDAVRGGLTPRSEADRELRIQIAILPTWLSESGPGASNPQHDMAAHGAVATASAARVTLCRLR